MAAVRESVLAARHRRTRWYGIVASAALACVAVFPGAAHAQSNYMPMDVPTVSGIVHLQDYADRPLANAQWAGTRGESRRLEGLALRLSGTGSALHLEYSCTLAGIGDEGPVAEGGFCGTRGQSRRLEAFQIRLVGPAAPFFSVRYQCYLEGAGESAVLSDNAPCGARGAGRRWKRSACGSNGAVPSRRGKGQNPR
jgi:hypothetical protein